MWLKDFLPKDVRNIRVMTYGYDSNLFDNEENGSRMSDLRKHLVQQIENSRSPEEVGAVPYVIVVTKVMR
jgi:hypothetical protein